MPFMIRYNPRLKAIETTFSGIVTETDVHAQMLARRAAAQTHNTSLAIVDVTQATLHLSLLFIYGLPELCESMGAKRPVRMALIDLNQQNTEAIGFYQLVSQNRGWNVEVFPNLEQAETWLLASD